MRDGWPRSVAYKLPLLKLVGAKVRKLALVLRSDETTPYTTHPGRALTRARLDFALGHNTQLEPRT